MDDYSIIKAHIETFQENLNRAIKTMDSPQIDAELRKAVRTRFHVKINYKKKQLGTLLKNIEEGLPLDGLWNAVIVEREECSNLLHECLAFIEGTLVRKAGLDNGICEIADALLVDISEKADVPWQRFTIMAEADFFTETTEIIRMRFPEFGIWNLPIVCHELGHFVATEVNKKKEPGVMDEISTAISTGKYPNREMLLQGEYFADLFATYAMGPAYVCTCILLNFNPTKISDSKEHPADVKRAYFMLKALEEMKKTEPQYEVIIKPLREVWQRNLIAANVKKLDTNVEQGLDVLVCSFLTRVLDKYLNTVKYESWHLAYLLSFNMKNKTPDSLLNGITLRDVLNAAWMWRIQKIKDSSEIGKKALDLSLALTQRENS